MKHVNKEIDILPPLLYRSSQRDYLSILLNNFGDRVNETKLNLDLRYLDLPNKELKVNRSKNTLVHKIMEL